MGTADGISDVAAEGFGAGAEAYERGRTIRGATRRTYDTPDERQAALERATLKLLKGA